MVSDHNYSRPDYWDRIILSYIPPLAVKMIGTKSIPRCWHKSLYLVVFVSSAALVPASHGAFGFKLSKVDLRDSPHAPAPEWLTAVGFTMLTSKASLLSQKGLPQTCPSVCLLSPFCKSPHKVAVK